ncbi:MAG: exported protein [Hyphobacterium sp.]|nr:MAG: exported protein [Hyphobacterium sp.]
MTQHSPTRRNILFTGTQTLSAAGLMAMMGSSAASAYQGSDNPAQDVQLLNAAIALEHEGIAAYTIAAGSGLLTPDVTEIGVRFRGHHREHRDALASAVTALGGTPVETESEAHYVEALGVASLANQADVLRLALGLETGAANAYLGLIPSLSTAEQHQLAAQMAGDEAYHAAILGHALGEPIPVAGMMFGG